MVLSQASAWAADRRVALIIGNSAYQTVPKLPNPAKDAKAIAQMFKDAGFDSVEVADDLGNLEFKRLIRKFEVTADHADIAVVYYAGHGLEISGTNFLIPVDAKLASDRDADDEAIPLERLVSSADGAKKLRVIILDSCRNNPFSGRLKFERKASDHTASSGLGKVEPTSNDTLIAYAAKAGSTAEDGDTEHSPFTTAILKSLTVPGLDIRLAFGRVKDEVMKSTAGRQEPYVYGSLGGDNISLVPAPAGRVEAQPDDVKSDYALVEKIGSRKAFEVFLGSHPTGIYADKARAQMKLMDETPVVLTSAPASSPPAREPPSSKDALEWDKVKDSTDQSALQKFIKRFPDSPLAITAQRRIDILRQGEQERADKARAEREATKKAAEDSAVVAQQKKADLEATKNRDDEERRARATETDLLAKAMQAEDQAKEAKRRADDAETTKTAAEVAALRAVSDAQAQQAAAARRMADLATAQESACRKEQSKFDALNAKGSEGLDDMKMFADVITCSRLRPQIMAAIDKSRVETTKPADRPPNSPDLIRAAQVQLIRVGCSTGTADGIMSSKTRSDLNRYLTVKGAPSSGDVPVTEALVSDLGKQSGRVCALECKSNETVEGDVCVAKASPSTPVASKRKNDDEDRKPKRQAEKKPEQKKSEQKPRQQASRQGAGAAGAGMVGVGF